MDDWNAGSFRATLSPWSGEECYSTVPPPLSCNLKDADVLWNALQVCRIRTKQDRCVEQGADGLVHHQVLDFAR